MNTENKTTKKKQYAFRPYSERNVDLKKNAKNLKNWLERNPEYKVKQTKVTVPKSFLNSFILMMISWIFSGILGFILGSLAAFYHESKID